MDQLKSCMDALRLLAKLSADPNTYLLGERSIVEYLESAGASKQKLIDEIDREADEGNKTFWITMREFSAGRSTD